MAHSIEVRSSDADSTHGPGLEEIAREGVQRMLVAGLETKVADYIARHQERDQRGRAQIVRNGKARARKVILGSGRMESLG